MPTPAGVTSGVCRFLSHIPLFLYGINGIQDLRFFQKHAGVLVQAPLGDVLLVAEKLGGGMGLAAFIWNFIMWIPTILCPGELLFFVGIVDAAITASIIAACAIQGGYYGLTKAQCARGPPAPGMSSTDRGLVFLQRLQEIDPENEGYPQSKCNGLLLKYYAGVVAIILYGIVTIANLGFGAVAWYEYSARTRSARRYTGTRTGTRTGKRTKHYTIAKILDIATFPLRIPLVILAAILGWLIGCIIRRFPERVQNRLFYARRWTSKWALGQRKSAVKASSSVTAKAHGVRRRLRDKVSSSREKSGRTRASLLHILEVDNGIVSRIAQNLHHLDLVNLSLASTGVYQSLYLPPSIPPATADTGAEGKQTEKHVEEETRYLRTQTCFEKAKLNCWGCGIQICKDCSTTKSCRPSAVSFHMKLCRARCSKCALAGISGYNAQRCRCRGGRDPKGIAEHYNFDLYLARTVCRECGGKSPEEVTERRAERDREVYWRLVQQPLACDVCSEALKRTGPVWWFCSQRLCGKECCSEEHPGWGRKVEV